MVFFQAYFYHHATANVNSRLVPTNWFSHELPAPSQSRFFASRAANDGVTGEQPEGTMEVSKETDDRTRESVIIIRFIFGGGIQGSLGCICHLHLLWSGAHHPRPGVDYSSAKLTGPLCSLFVLVKTFSSAKLPDNADGQKLVKLLRTAFDRKLLFKVAYDISQR